jgi:inner membrane protein
LDNVTHTLIGALVGETAARYAPAAATERQARIRRAMFLSVMIVGSNLPDSDLLYSLGTGNKLRYLLEHRGHTHTVVGAMLASVAMLIACALWQRCSRMSLSMRDRAWLIGLALLAPLLHIAMDACNSYGVHPWWPFDDRWYYGDSVFIVEPLFWAAAAPLVFLLRSYVARGLVVLVLLAGFYLAYVTGLVMAASIALYGVLILAMLVLARTTPPKIALAAGIAAWLTVTAVFALAHRLVAERMDAYALAHTTDWTMVDRVLTPMPMNPLCWDVILIQSQGDRYALRRAIASIPPMQALRCPTRSLGGTITAPLQDVALPNTPDIVWHGEIVGSRDRLRTLAATSCEVAAFLRFARAPWVTESDERRVIGDLRFDREPELGFAELDLARRAPCPRYVPPWIPPRSDLLQR